MNKKEIRIEKLKAILNEKGLIHIKEMAELLGVSEMTVRRDVHILEQDEKIKNVNGLLISPLDSSFALLAKTYNISDEVHTQNEAKSAIGRFAATMIEEGDSVLFDIGTTVEKIAKYARRDISFDAFCLSLNTLLRLIDNPGATIALAGGYYHPSIQAFLSDDGLKFIRSIRANTLFLSAAGIHEDLGVSCVSPYEVNAKRAMLQSTIRHILVADSSKFGVIRSGYFCDLTEIHEIITDDRLPDKWVSLIEERNIRLHRIPIK